jgi:hypothetical protein
MSQIKVNAVTDGSGGNTATINSMTPTADSLQGFRNRIINGAMVIDQRNAGASVTITNTGANTYTLDRWAAYGSAASKFSVQQNAGSVTPPVGFTNYLGCTSLSAYTVGAAEIFTLQQQIEGFNFADLNFGSANAKTVTISFWVRSSLTGAFAGFLNNSAQNRTYPFSYTISAANTWEQKSVTIAGDTTGTWIGSTNGIGAGIWFSLGCGSTFQGTANAWTASTTYGVSGQNQVVGTNGATWYITGVQLEVGSVATPFERRDYGTELSRCFRYFQMISSGNNSALPIQFIGQSGGASTAPFGNMPLVSAMRTAPTFVQTASQWRFNSSNGDVNVNGTWTVNTGGFEGANYQSINVSFSATASVGAITQARIFTNGGYLGASAEL